MYILTIDRSTTDLASWKISNGHISATGHLIHFTFGFSIGGFQGQLSWSNGAIYGCTKFKMVAGHHLQKFRMAISYGRRIHFMLGSRVGFSWSADRMALLPVGPNLRWWPATTLENFNGPYLWQWVIRSTSCFVLGRGFLDRWIKWRYCPLHQTQVGGRPPSWKILNGHISATGCSCLVLG